MEAMAESGVGISLGEEAAAYLDWSRAQNKPSTYSEKVSLARTVLRHFAPERPLSSLGASDIEHGYKVQRKRLMVSGRS